MRDSRTPPLPVWAHWRPDELVLALHVQPGARRTALAGAHGARLKLALQAPPVDGKANEELLRFLAQTLGLRRAQLRLLAGASSRQKTIAIDADATTACRLLAQLADAGAGPTCEAPPATSAPQAPGRGRRTPK